MASKKSAAKKGAGKSASKKSSKSSGGKSYVEPQPLYGVAIREAVARGDAAELRRVRAAANKQVSEIQAALKELDAALGES